MRKTHSRLLLLASLVAPLAVGCDRGATRYEIQYCFDNTAMHSDFLEAYELTTEGANGKWRSTNHHLDTVVSGGDTVEWASGSISDVARENCVALKIFTTGYRPCGGGNYTLDTVYRLKVGERNVIHIHPDQTWTPTYAK